LVNGNFTTTCSKLKLPENYLNTIENIIETKNLLTLICSSNTFLPIIKDSIQSTSLIEFKTHLLDNCPNLSNKKIISFIRLQKYYLVLMTIIYICGILSTILYFI
jgi:hypothetical protein